jgi:hypothetical protein
MLRSAYFLHFQAGGDEASLLDEEPIVEQTHLAMLRWRERLIEADCVPTSRLLDQIDDACRQMLCKFDKLFAVAQFDFNEPGSPQKYAFASSVYLTQ